MPFAQSDGLERETPVTGFEELLSAGDSNLPEIPNVLNSAEAEYQQVSGSKEVIYSLKFSARAKSASLFCSNVAEMEKEGKNQGTLETDFLLQWGSRKRLRCAKVKGNGVLEKSDGTIRKRNASRVDHPIIGWEKETLSVDSNCFNRNSDTAAALRLSEGRKPQAAGSPDGEEDRYYYPTRGSGLEDVGKIFGEGMDFVWPKFFISLSCKEKEEDFMAMKGCKLPQRPKKRAKFIQKYLQVVSPGAWLSELCQERYEVREKKNSKKRPRGLKAMGSLESDSE